MAAEDWAAALQEIVRGLVDEPDSHWLLATGSSALYEQRKYRDAVVWIDKAYAIMPDCPLVLWHQASIRSILAIRAGLEVYQKIVDAGLEAILQHPCNESEAWGRSLYNDSRYRIVTLLVEADQRSGRECARKLFKEYEAEVRRGTETDADAEGTDRLRAWLDDSEWFVPPPGSDFSV